MSGLLKNETFKDVQYHFLLSERLDDALKLANISQQKLSDELEVHPTTVTNWKKQGKNKKGIHLNMLKRIANILDVDVEYLYDPNHNSPCLSAQKRIEECNNHKKKYRKLFDYMRVSGFEVEYISLDNEVVIFDSSKHSYQFDEKALERFNALMQAHINYELLNSCTKTSKY